MNTIVRTVLAFGFQLAAISASALAQKAQWTDVVYVPGRWVAGRLVRATTRTAGPSDSLALVMRVDYFANPPRWRAEVRRSPDGVAFDEAQVLLGNAATVLVVTPVGTTPLAQHAAGRDSLVAAAVAVMEPAGRRSGASAGRLVEKAGGTVRRVVFRRAVRSPTFDDRILDPRSVSQFAAAISSRVASVGDQRSASVVATAGARGVDNVQTPGGTVPVTPDTMAVVRMERFAVGDLALEDFMRKGSLGPYAAVADSTPPDTAAADTARPDSARADTARADTARADTAKKAAPRPRPAAPRRPRRQP